jgi:predicted DNA-binding protein (MmcQ/YjbR family)
MTLDSLRSLCTSLPHVTEDIKWGNDLCFSIGGKMFCVTGMSIPLMISLKVKDEEFDELSNLPGIKPAPYVARYKWILIEDERVFSKPKWEFYIRQSYALVKSKLSKKILTQLG